VINNEPVAAGRADEVVAAGMTDEIDIGLNHCGFMFHMFRRIIILLNAVVLL
jgi:hypothetical protein